MNEKRVILPIDLGGSQHQCWFRPPLREQMLFQAVSDLWQHTIERRGAIDELLLVHGGIPAQWLLGTWRVPIRLSIDPMDLMVLGLASLVYAFNGLICAHVVSAITCLIVLLRDTAALMRLLL